MGGEGVRGQSSKLRVVNGRTLRNECLFYQILLPVSLEIRMLLSSACGEGTSHVKV